MKNFLLSSVGLLFASAGFAQSTVDTALPMVNGANQVNYEQASANQDVYWKYTSDDDELIIAVAINGSNLTCYELNDAGQQVRINGTGYTAVQDGNYVIGYAYPVPKGKTVYVCANAFQTIGFTADIRKSPGVTTGTSESDWGVIVPGTMQFFGNDANNNSGNPICAVYTPERDGVLKLSTTSSVSSVTDEAGVQYSFDYDRTTYASTASVKVIGGKENRLKIGAWGSVLLTSEMTYPEPGSYDMPFTVVAGTNAVPKAAGTYWYVAAADKAGMVSVTSDEALEGGQVSVYSSVYNVSNNRPDAQSVAGSYNVSFAAQAGTTYYIKVEKPSATESDQAFGYELAAYKDGDTEDQPIVISDFSQEYSVPAGRTVYYAVSIPAGVKKVLSVAATSEVKNAATEVSVYQYSYSAVSGNSSVVTTVSGDYYGATYKVKWTSREDSEITFKASLDDLAKGDDISNPLEAQLGDNALTGNGVKYYEFRAPETGKLDVTVPEGVALKFPKTEGYGYLSALQNGNTYSLDVEKDNLYKMELSNCVKDAVFTVAYGEWAEGESASKPIVVTGSEYVLGAETVSNLWLKYTATQDCKLTIDASAIPYNYSDKVEYCLEGALDKIAGLYSYADGTASYMTTFGAGEGDSYLVHVSLSAAHEGAAIKFAETPSAQGETVGNPIVLAAGETVSVPAADYYNPVWVKLQLKEGDATLVADKMVYGSVYMSKEDAKSDQNPVYANFFETTEEGKAAHYDYSMSLTEDTECYLKVTSAEACTLSAVYGGGETGIGAASANGVQPVAYYTLDGVQIAAPQNGVNIVKLSDGRTVKMVVRK